MEVKYSTPTEFITNTPEHLSVERRGYQWVVTVGNVAHYFPSLKLAVDYVYSIL